MAFDLDPSYKQVPERIADFKAKHPDGCLRPADPSRPFTIEELGGRTFIVYVAAAYRTPDDPTPGIGVAWELFPGKTPYTRDSELQNAETSAWGRAIVAALASESKSIASAEDVRNRQADRDPANWSTVHPDVQALLDELTELGDKGDALKADLVNRAVAVSVEAALSDEGWRNWMRGAIDHHKAQPAEGEQVPE